MCECVGCRVVGCVKEDKKKKKKKKKKEDAMTRCLRWTWALPQPRTKGGGGGRKKGTKREEEKKKITERKNPIFPKKGSPKTLLCPKTNADWPGRFGSCFFFGGKARSPSHQISKKKLSTRPDFSPQAATLWSSRVESDRPNARATPPIKLNKQKPTLSADPTFPYTLFCFWWNKVVFQYCVCPFLPLLAFF